MPEPQTAREPKGDPSPPVEAGPNAGHGVDDLLDELSLSPALAVEQCDASAATLYLTSTGTRLRIPRALYDAALAFEMPRTIASVTEDDARLARALTRLHGLGFLVGSDAGVLPSRSVTDPPVRLFDCPAYKRSHGDIDLVVIGVPYDGGDYAAAGARHGPAALRQTSLQLLYGLDRRSGRPLGWFDADLARPLLRGVTIGDGGDVLVSSGEPQDQTFARVRGVVADLVGEGQRRCALLGGDVTTCFPLIDAMQARGRLGVVRIGDIDRGLATAASPFLSPSTLPGRLLALPKVDSLVQIGACDPIDNAPPGFASVTVPHLVDHGIRAIEPYLAPGTALHLGLDLAALATPLDALGTPSSRARFSYTELRALLDEIGARYRIVSVDLVGANPLKRGWGAAGMAAIHLLLAMLDAATARRDRDLAA